MRMFKALRGIAVVVCLAVGLMGVMANAAMAAPLKICVPEREGAAIRTPKKGVCAAKSTATVLLPEVEEEKLAAILPYEKYVASGVGGKPTIQVSGANVQIESGAGTEEAPVNGEGNLIIGYDEGPGTQTGSNNLVLGGPGQNYTRYGSILGGGFNTASGIETEVFGQFNAASGSLASVTGGDDNNASETFASVSGGESNTASGFASSVSAGIYNTASGYKSSVSGGYDNGAEGPDSSVSGEAYKHATGFYQWLP